MDSKSAEILKHGAIYKLLISPLSVKITMSEQAEPHHN